MNHELLTTLLAYPSLLAAIFVAGQTSDLNLKVESKKHLIQILVRVAIVIVISAIPGFIFGFHPLLILGVVILLATTSMFFLELTIPLVLIYLWITMSPKTSISSLLILKQEEKSVTVKPAKHHDEVSQWVGQIGTATTDLRPTGSINISDQTFEAKAKHGMIKSGTKVKIVASQLGPMTVTELVD